MSVAVDMVDTVDQDVFVNAQHPDKEDPSRKSGAGPVGPRSGFNKTVTTPSHRIQLHMHPRLSSTVSR
jgi:hypothetical protein